MISAASDNESSSSSDEKCAPVKKARKEYGALHITKESYDNFNPNQNRKSIIMNNCRAQIDTATLSDDSSTSSDQFEDAAIARIGFQERGFNDDNDDDRSYTDCELKEKLESTNSLIKNESAGSFSASSKRMMSKMGWTGKGLGRHEDGRTVPVEASGQKGRRGLGMAPSELGQFPENFEWQPDDTKPKAEEHVIWIESPTYDLHEETLKNWLYIGPKKLTIDDECNFVDPTILKGILNAKTMFDRLDTQEFLFARNRSNPYETIGSVIFLNRAAVKMANIDAICDFMFTEPNKCKEKKDNSQNEELLYFADVCAGPGGFSEYVLYRKQWMAKGFGFTLKGSNDFKLYEFCAGTPESFHTFYGVNDDGNIFSPENLESLKSYIMAETNNEGVHFLMADGGFSVEGQENIQEILSKQLYLCQCLAALMVVRIGGHLVVKLFDIFTQFSVGLIYIMYKCFDKVSIHKPVTSRPANSERYLICKRKRPGTEDAERHLFYVNQILNDNKDNNDDVLELVPLHILKDDEYFLDYIYKSNCTLGEKQVKNLLKIAAYSKNKDLKEESQTEIKNRCLELWQLPDRVRTRPAQLNADETLNEVLDMIKEKPSYVKDAASFKKMVLDTTPSPNYLKTKADLEKFRPIHNWYFQVLASNYNNRDAKFFIGCGGKRVNYLNQTSWKDLDKHFIELPAKTLFYGEIVKECKGEGGYQMRSKSLHIIDALVLGGINISYLPLSKRIEKCKMFCTALKKSSIEHNELPLRCKALVGMHEFPYIMDGLLCKIMKDVGRAWTINVPNTDDQFHAVGSVIFIKELREPWNAHISKKFGCKYYYKNTPNSKTGYELLEEASLDMLHGYLSSVLWPANCPFSAVYDDSENAVTRQTIVNFIQDMKNQ